MGSTKMRFRALITLALGLLAGCKDPPAPVVLDAATGSAAPSRDASASAVPKPTASAPPRSRPARPRGDAAPAPVGGNWLRCHAQFQPRTDPKRDVMRLGLMCGPSNGMRQVTDATESELGDGGGREHRFSAQAGDCYRIFAVGEPSVADLDVEVFDPTGSRIAWDTGEDRWPIVEPDGPFCVVRDGEYRARVRAQRGAGSYALEIWRLR